MSHTLWEISFQRAWFVFQMICKSCSTFISSHLNIKGYKMPHTFGTSFEEFGAAENFVIGKINNIYSVEMQISLRLGPMNNWVRTITLNNSFLNILQCVFLWPEGKLSFVTAAMCGGNYAERLRPLLIAGRSSSMPAGFFREEERWRKKDGKTETENGESKQSFSPSFFLPSYSYPLTMLSITEMSCTSSPCLCLPLLSRILMLIELITCGMLYFFSICTS